MSAERQSYEIAAIDNPYAGPVYKELCDLYPLIKISNDSLYQSAKDTFLKLIRYKKKESRDQTTVDQINAYMGSLGLLIKSYETDQYKFKKPHPADLLKDLMERHSLTQSDFAKEIGPQSKVSLILSKKKDLSVKQVRALAKRFNLNPTVFIQL